MLSSSFLGRWFVLCTIALQSGAYFSFYEPKLNAKWQSNGVNVIAWAKGKLDGIDTFDIEFTRLSISGNWMVAKGVSHRQTSLNIFIQSLPAADDYLVLFINSTNGAVFAASPRFTILSTNATASSSSFLTPVAGAPTVTVSSTPNPTQQFATTFPAGENSALTLRQSIGKWKVQVVAICATAVTGFFGGVWAVL
ncbi:hypothetical protein APHAL10511_005505 [Amanita phalloides]|nr:hypothetical protein APHAL10511_005505 [Amanita phalloides]